MAAESSFTMKRNAKTVSLKTENYHESEKYWSKCCTYGVIGGVGLTRFSDGVKDTQVVGLFGSGMVVGTALTAIINTFRTKPKAS